MLRLASKSFTTYSRLVLLVCYTAVVYNGVDGHGRLVEPPSRASMWRYGYATKPDVQDNQLWCGGFTIQWKVNGGKCGVCGDPWNTAEPRDHELGGRFGSGIIVRRYRPGDVLPVVVELTAAHGGYFEFRVCPVERNSTSTGPRDPSIDCLDRNVLQLASDRGKDTTKWSRRYMVGARAARMHALDVQLPSGLECKHCLLQWKYHTGNSWGQDANGTSCLGCGDQEQFYGCADIAIVNSTQHPQRSVNKVRATTHVPIAQPHSTSPSQTTAVIHPLAAEITVTAVRPAVDLGGSDAVVRPSESTTASSASLLPTKKMIQFDGQPYDVVMYSSENGDNRHLPDNITDMDLVKIWGSSSAGESVHVIPAWYVIADRLHRRLYALDPPVYRRLAAAAAQLLARRWRQSLLKSAGSLTRFNRDVESTTTGVQLSQLLVKPRRV